MTPGDALGIDLREEALTHGRQLARDRGLSNVMFQVATVYQLPCPDAAFDAAFACAVLQHLAAPHAALTEMRRVLKPGGVIGIMDGSSTITFRYPTNPLLEAWDTLRGRERQYRTGRPAEALQLRVLLREAGFTRTQASGAMTTEAGPPAGRWRRRAAWRRTTCCNCAACREVGPGARLGDPARAGADGRSPYGLG